MWTIAYTFNRCPRPINGIALPFLVALNINFFFILFMNSRILQFRYFAILTPKGSSASISSMDDGCCGTTKYVLSFLNTVLRFSANSLNQQNVAVLVNPLYS